MIIHNVVQNSAEWFELRKGKPTASMFSNLVTPKTLKPSKSDYHIQLATETLLGFDPDEWVGNADTDHGHDAELHATKAYQDKTGLLCEPVGFVTDDNELYGCSPDRLVGSDGILEIKSPRAKNVIKYWMEYVETNECPADFKIQVQGQLMITERDWCDLTLYHPNLPLKVVRVIPNKEIHSVLLEQIHKVMQKRDATIQEMVDF